MFTCVGMTIKLLQSLNHRHQRLHQLMWPVFAQFERKPAKILFSCPPGTGVVLPSPSAPHPFSKLRQCADEGAFTFPPASSPPLPLIHPSTHQRCSAKCLHTSMFFPPTWCDPGLRAPGGESLSLPFKDSIWTWGAGWNVDLNETSPEFGSMAKTFISVLLHWIIDKLERQEITWVINESLKWCLVIGLNPSLGRACPPFKTDVVN